MLTQFALRWRTEDEVISGLGDETCGNTRCLHHEPSKALAPPPLKTVELPFAYEEAGEHKAALVKVMLCGKCLKKLMWKREKEKERQAEERAKDAEEIIQKAVDAVGSEGDVRSEGLGRRNDKERDRRRSGDEQKRHRDSRSRSPKSRDRYRKHNRPRRSPS